jgi:hypothetical protein
VGARFFPIPANSFLHRTVCLHRVRLGVDDCVTRCCNFPFCQITQSSALEGNVSLAMNTAAPPAFSSEIDQLELVGLQRAGAFLSQRQKQHQVHAHSPPIAIPRPQHLVAGTQGLFDSSDESFQPRAPTSAQRGAALACQAPTASSSFLATIRRGLQDNSPSWNNNGWFIGSDSDEEDDDDEFYSSMLFPYGGAADATAYAGCCAPAGSFAGFADTQAPVPDFLDFDIASAVTRPIEREGSLIFAMEV